MRSEWINIFHWCWTWMRVIMAKSTLTVTAPQTMIDTEPPSPSRSRKPLTGDEALQAEKSFPFDFENMRNTLLEEKDNSPTCHKQSRKPPLLLSPDPESKSDESSSSVALLDSRKRVSSPTSPNLRAFRHGFKVPPSPPYVPVVGAQSIPGHQRLRETHSWDPNMPPDLNSKRHLSAPTSRTTLYRQDSDETPVHGVQKCKLRNSNSLPSEPKPRLRPMRSCDAYSSDQDGSRCDLLHPMANNNNTIAPSPATKRRLNYLQKLAASMRPGSRSSSPSSSRRSTMSSSQDGDSPCPSPGPSTPDRSSDEGGFDAFPTPPSSPSVMHKGRQSTSPGNHAHGGSRNFMPRKIWRSKSKSSHQSGHGHQTTLWNPEVSHFACCVFLWHCCGTM